MKKNFLFIVTEITSANCVCTINVMKELRNKGNNVPVIWSDEKLELDAYDNIKNRFFVRIKETPSIVEKVSECFGEIKPLDIGIEGECAFITNVMTEKEFNKCVESLPELITRIRFM